MNSLPEHLRDTARAYPRGTYWRLGGDDKTRYSVMGIRDDGNLVLLRQVRHPSGGWMGVQLHNGVNPVDLSPWDTKPLTQN